MTWRCRETIFVLTYLLQENRRFWMRDLRVMSQSEEGNAGKPSLDQRRPRVGGVLTVLDDLLELVRSTSVCWAKPDNGD